MDRFSELKAFVDVVEAGSFSAAGRATGQSRSSVNRLVIALEERLGVQLLHRTTRSVSANSNGRALYKRAKQLLDDLEEIEMAVSSTRAEPMGKLRVSAPHSFGDLDISEIVAAFLKTYPKVEIDLTFENRFVDPVSEGYDLVIRVAEPDEQTDLVDHRIVELEYLICASPDYLKDYGEPETLRDIAYHQVLALSRSGHSDRWALVGPTGHVNVPIQPVLSANGLDALLTATCFGLGLAILPGYAIRTELESGALRQILSDYRLPPRVLQVIYPPSRHLSAKEQHFTDFVKDWCNK